MKLDSTTEYTRFKRIVGNRPLRKAHVRNLVTAISKDATTIRYNPILVNDKMEVIDGEHRLAAIKQLGMPVYYIQEPDLTLENVINLNSGTKAWTPTDFAESYKERGNENYAIYLDFKKEFGFNHDILLRYLSLDNPITGDMFRQGKLKVGNVKKSLQLCNDLQEVGQYYDRFNNRSFALGFYMLWKNKSYDHKRMVQKLSVHKAKMHDCALPEQYADLLQKIYNIGVMDHNRVWFNKER